MARKTRKKKKSSKRRNDRILIIVFGLAVILLICLGVFLWSGDDNGSTVTSSPDGTSVLTEFRIGEDSWCEQNPTFCNSDGLIDQAMCWMPSSALLPAAGSGSCWAISTMEISWFHLKQKFDFLPDLRSVCDSAPSNISSYLAGIQQNRKGIDNVLASMMTSIESDSLHSEEICNGMKKEISEGDPVLVVIGLSYSGTSEIEAAHGVVACGYTETENETRFIIADSNTARPNPSSETLVFDKSGGDWSYEASYHPHWYNLSIGFLKISSLGVPSLP